MRENSQAVDTSEKEFLEKKKKQSREEEGQRHLKLFWKDPVKDGKIIDIVKLQEGSSNDDTAEARCTGASQLSRKHHWPGKSYPSYDFFLKNITSFLYTLFYALFTI